MIVMAIQITAVRWIYIPLRIAAVVGFCVSLTMQRRLVLLAIVNFWDATRGGVIAMAPMAMVVRRLWIHKTVAVVVGEIAFRVNRVATFGVSGLTGLMSITVALVGKNAVLARFAAVACVSAGAARGVVLVKLAVLVGVKILKMMSTTAALAAENALLAIAAVAVSAC